MISLIYVSQSRINPADRARMMDDIMTISIARNTMLGITGLLIASPHHFAQLLEGPTHHVLAVMSSITSDPRNATCRILRRARIEQVSSPHWRVARYDSHNFGIDVIDPLLMAAHAGIDPHAIHRLQRLIEIVALDPALVYPADARR